MTAQYAAVDWGTSSFRLWLVGGEGSILSERRSGQGMSQLAPDQFSGVLEEHLAAAGARDDLPVIMCGMVGARQGWHEAGYVEVPAALRDVLDGAVRLPGVARDIRILPGLAQYDADAPDVMRGEETQLLGADTISRLDGLVCMPGTHAKWVAAEGGRVQGFSTFMTGELFEVLRHHSILKHAICAQAPSGEPGGAFTKAVHQGFDRPAEFTNSLFQLRAGRLLHDASSEDVWWHLSGLLIGLEIAGACGLSGSRGRVVLIASGQMEQLYRTALHALDIETETVDADLAVREGLKLAAGRFWQASNRSEAI